MAATEYGVNHPLAVKLWSRKLFLEALKATWFSKFIGTDSNSLVQLQSDTQKGPGDRIDIGLRMQLTGDGVTGDETLEGQEEALTTYDFSIFIDQLRHAVRSKGRMSEQRVPFNVREEARNGLTDWWAGRMDEAFFNQLCGYTTETKLARTGLQAPVAPDSDHIMFAGSEASEASLSATTTHALKLSDIDKMVAKAKTLSPLIRPLRIGGTDHYCLFLHPFQVYQLRQDATTAGNWIDIQKAAMQGGDVANNPIFSGALGIYNNVILHEAQRITPIVGTPASGSRTDFRRAVLAGAQAIALAYGQNGGPNKMEWVEELFDYGNQLGVSAALIHGIAKTRFNSKDFSSIVLSSYAPDPTA